MRILWIVGILCLISVAGYAQTDSINVVTQDDVIPEKRVIGRYDRGIKNHLFVKEKTWMTGLTVSYIGYDSKDTQFMSLLKDFNCDANMFGINAFCGFFVKNNICVGMKMGYSKLHASLGNISIDIDEDMNFSLKDMAFNQELLSTTLFHRSYVGLDSGKRFGLFNETSLSLNMGTSHYERGTEETKDTKTNIRELQIGLNPGITVFIMENVAAEVSFGVVGFKYRQEKQTVDGEESGWRKSSGANFKINLLNISIGIVAYL